MRAHIVKLRAIVKYMDATKQYSIVVSEHIELRSAKPIHGLESSHDAAEWVYTVIVDDKFYGSDRQIFICSVQS
jgi:hypothetical protein